MTTSTTSAVLNISSPGRTQKSRLEGPFRTNTVAPFAEPVRRSRPGPVFGITGGVFQPVTSGKYLFDKSISRPHRNSSSSISAGTEKIRRSERDLRINVPPRKASTTPGAWMYYQNVRGVRTKIDELFLAAVDCNHDVIMLTETGLDDCISSVQLFGAEYDVYRCDRNIRNSNKTSFGGVLIAVAKRFQSSLVTTINGIELEQVCVATTIRGKKIFLCAVYIPPDRSRDAAIIEAHIATVRELCNLCSPDDIVLICGDFNQPHLLWEDRDDELIAYSDSVMSPASIALLDGMQFMNMRQNNLQKNYRNRFLDLVFCSLEYQISVDVSAAPLLPIDPHHPPLVLSLKYDSVWYHTASHPVDLETRKLNFRRLDFVALIEYISGIDWLTALGSGNVDDMAQIFCNVLCDWFESNVPPCRRAPSPVWSTSHLRSLKRERNKCQRKLRSHRTPVSKQAFQRASNAYRRLNASLYKMYTLRVQTNLRRNHQSF